MRADYMIVLAVVAVVLTGWALLLFITRDIPLTDAEKEEIAKKLEAFDAMTPDEQQLYLAEEHLRDILLMQMTMRITGCIK